MATPRYHQRAKADLQAIWRYLATRNPTAADRYLRELQERAFLMQLHPHPVGQSQT
ncbi:MAG: type II toxin-antitoxin system RelE/ParE family toxin [Deltaproteobacteria bacterium]|nr:type II toxin-antitoxin system RelE/ParE family toxin [Deltaproteobacteria bacterium]